MMRVLDISVNDANYNALQFLRGALMYARQNWLHALALAYMVGSAIYKWHTKGDVRSWLVFTTAALILAFWWIYDPGYKQSRGLYTNTGVACGIGLTMSSSANDIVKDPEFGIIFFLLTLGFGLVWPWIHRWKTPRNFIAWMFGGAVAIVVLVFTLIIAAGFFKQ